MSLPLPGQKLIAFLLALCLWLQPNFAYAAALASPETSQTSSITPEQCQAISEAELRPELTHTIQGFFDNETHFDFQAQVNRQWQLLNLDGKIDSAASQAVATLQGDTKLLDKFASSWSPSRAEELGDRITTATFNDPALQAALQKLADNVSQQLADEIELATVQSASYGMTCLQTFISGQYSQTFLDRFDQRTDATAESSAADIITSFSPESRKYISSYGLAAGGVTSIAIAQITRRVTRGMAKRVFSQLSGRVLGRLGTTALPLVGEILGGALIVSDLAQSFSGSFGEIESQLQSPIVKQTLRDAISNSIEQDIGGESPQIAREIANDLYANWLDFQKDYRETLTLAEDLPEFQAILGDTTDLSSITALVGIALDNMGRRNLIAAIQDGSFAQALTLPPSSRDIIKTTGSIPEAVAWSELAGNQINQVVELELYKHLSRDGLDRSLLLDILGLDDAIAIAKLSLLNNSDIRRLLAIATPNLIQLTTHVSAQDLQRLSGYITNLQQTDANDLIKYLLDNGSDTIKNAEAMTHIVQSQDINAAIQFWQQPSSVVDLLKSAMPVAVGAIAWQLVLTKYGGLSIGLLGGGITGGFLLVVAIVLWFYRQILTIRQKLAQLKSSKD